MPRCLGIEKITKHRFMLSDFEFKSEGMSWVGLVRRHQTGSTAAF